jgi:LysR family transcriptional regulator, glycine cleavage system transcriptional activator
MSSLRRDLPLANALLVFEAAARHGHLTRAAAELCIAASAVSRHVANLERQSGLTLFVRNGNRLELTPAGRRLADATREGFGHVRDALASLRKQAGNRTLTIGCSYDLAHTWLMPRFRALAEVVPHHELRVITSDSYANFDAPDVDVSVRYGRGHWSEFAAARLFGEEVFPICAPSDGLAGLTWSDWLRSEGIALPSVSGPVFANYSLLLLELVAGRGLALGFANIVDTLLADGRVARLTKRSLRSDYGLYAVYREPAPTPIANVVDLLRRSAGATITQSSP